MPKRTDLSSILIIGSGPIVIGQGAEFDYSGTQAVRALKEEGYRVILVNSNPATIMTDPEIADRTYIEPVTPEWVARVIERERPDALLPTMGGQTALNVAMALVKDGTLAKYGVELIGANERAIRIAEDRAEFAQAMVRIGLATPAGSTVTTLDEGLDALLVVVRVARQTLCAPGERQVLRQVLLVPLVDELLDDAHRIHRAAREQRSLLEGEVHQLVVGHEPVGEADPVGLLALDGLTRHLHPERVGHANELG